LKAVQSTVIAGTRPAALLARGIFERWADEVCGAPRLRGRRLPKDVRDHR